MQRFERALNHVKTGDDDFINAMYWLNTCPDCGQTRSINCGRAWAVLSMMGQLTFSVPVELEVS